MAAKLTFVLGGASSGKTAFAQSLCEAASQECVYVATARALDEEMKAKIERHRRLRGDKWRTIEAPLELSRAIAELNSKEGASVLVDCMTLWITNQMGGDDNKTDARIFSLTEEIIESIRLSGKHVVMVSNETGLGIVPDNPLSRRFRDVSGKVNQMIAAASDETYMVTAGIPIKLKG